MKYNETSHITESTSKEVEKHETHLFIKFKMHYCKAECKECILNLVSMFSQIHLSNKLWGYPKASSFSVAYKLNAEVRGM